MKHSSAAAELAAYLANSPDTGIRDVSGLNVGRTVQAQEQAPGLVSQSIILPLAPSANRYWRNYNGRTVVSEEAKAYKAGVWMVAQHQGLRPFAGPVAVYVHVYRKQQRGDLDNSAKVLCDSLNGIAYQDDAQIVELHLYRHDDKNNPRVEVEVRRVEP